LTLKLIPRVAAVPVILFVLALFVESRMPLSAEEGTQRGWFGRGRSDIMSSSALPIENIPQTGEFIFLRVRFDEAYTSYGGYEWGLDMGWNHDYPRAEHNITMMLGELTNIPVTIDFRGGNILSFSEPEIFDYPFVYISEPAYWVWSDEEVLRLRNYLLKGGFLIFDDFHSDAHWYNLETQMRKVLPELRWIQLEATHPVYHVFFDIDSLEYEQAYPGYDPIFFGLFEQNDPNGRLLAVANHNNDIGEYWEYSMTGWVPIDLSNEAFKLGVNYILYALTH